MHVLLRKLVIYLLPRLRLKNGFSFIELAITLAILMAAFIPLLYFFTNGLNIGRETEVTTQCVIVAQDLMEEILSKSFEETAGSFGRETGESTANRINYDDVDGLVVGAVTIIRDSVSPGGTYSPARGVI